MTTYSLLTEITCCKCGILYAMPEDWLRHKREDGGNFYCPNGHSQVFSKTQVAILKEQLEAKEQELRASKCDVLKEKNLKEQAESKQLKSERRLRRVDKGVCPCCNRSFMNLQRHMETKHPAKNAA